MADEHLFPIEGSDGYESPFSTISYSKGPKVIYGDPDVYRVVLNDPQTDEDDEWGRTEMIAFMQIITEQIEVRKALFGWSSIRGLSDKYTILESVLDIDYDNTENTVLTIGDTVLEDGSLTLGEGVSYTTTELSMNNQKLRLYKVTGDEKGAKLLSGDSDVSGIGDASIYLHAALSSESDSAAYIEFLVNGAAYRFSDTAFVMPASVALSITDLTVTNLIATNLTLTGTISVDSIIIGGNTLTSNVCGDSNLIAEVDYFYVGADGSYQIVVDMAAEGDTGSAIQFPSGRMLFASNSADETLWSKSTTFAVGAVDLPSDAVNIYGDTERGYLSLPGGGQILGFTCTWDSIFIKNNNFYVGYSDDTRINFSVVQDDVNVSVAIPHAGTIHGSSNYCNETWFESGQLHVGGSYDVCSGGFVGSVDLSAYSGIGFGSGYLKWHRGTATASFVSGLTTNIGLGTFIVHESKIVGASVAILEGTEVYLHGNKFTCSITPLYGPGPLPMSMTLDILSHSIDVVSTTVNYVIFYYEA